ncbi:MAG: hypothetical protein PVG89_01295 [Gammaproteobacteria bacterium]|jgi:hypothetical protein
MPVISKLKEIFHSIRSWSLYKIYRRYTNIYLGIVTIGALIGYVYLLLFPFGVIFGAWQLYALFPAPLNLDTALSALVWLSVILFGAGMTHGIVTLKFRDLDGIALPPAKAQLIYDKIHEIQQDIQWPPINNVVVTRRFELNIIKTPIRGIPFWSRTTLVIGIPFMQSLSPEQFDCALTRRILQFSKRRNVFYNWLSFLRVTWSLYPDTFGQRAKVGDRISYWFFYLYSRLYRHAALYATQLDELHADAMALNALNDRDLFRTVETARLAHIFLNQHYWPKINELVKRNSIALHNIRPYDHISKSVIQVLQSPRVKDWLKMLSLEKQSQGRHEPPFAERMEFMGYNKTVMVQPFTRTAAMHYFGNDTDRLVQHMNELWVRNLGSRNRKSRHHHAMTHAQQRLKAAI